MTVDVFDGQPTVFILEDFADGAALDVEHLGKLLLFPLRVIQVHLTHSLAIPIAEPHFPSFGPGLL